jgi:hypothetical protein
VAQRGVPQYVDTRMMVIPDYESSSDRRHSNVKQGGKLWIHRGVVVDY